MSRAGLALAAAALAGCVSGIDPEWQLDHDHVVAVRATPPHLPAGDSAMFDALVAHKGAPTDVEQPVFATVALPMDLASAVTIGASGPVVTAPDEATLEAERVELGLPPGTPVPLDVVMQFPDSNGIHLLAKKTVYLGDSGDNPPGVGDITIDGAAAPASIVVPIDVDVPLATDVDPADQVNWLTSAGTMHDDDEYAAFLHVQTSDPKQGEFVVVVRDPVGGVVWQVWPITAQ